MGSLDDYEAKEPKSYCDRASVPRARRTISPTLNESIIANTLFEGRLVTICRLVFTDGVRWRLRLPLQPESRRTRKLFRARGPVGRSDGDRPFTEPDCARMAAHSEVIGVGATKEGKMAPNFS